MIATAPSSTRVRIRPIRAEDLDGLTAFYARLSPESRFGRFLGVSRGDEASRLLCGPDHEHREGFVAEPSHQDSTDGRIVGHICLELAGPAIEMAVAVADEWQSRGIGQALLLAAVDWARAHRIGLLQASALSTNSAVLGLIASIGRPVRESSPSGGVVVATIDVGAPFPLVA